MPRELAREYADRLNGSMNSCFKISLIFGVGIFLMVLLFDKYRNKVIKVEASSVSNDYKRSGETKAIRNTPIVDLHLFGKLFSDVVL